MATLIDLHPNAAYRYFRIPIGILVDIRSSMEYLFVGHPVGAVHIAWIDEPDWQQNPDFIPQIIQLAEAKFKNIDVKREASIFINLPQW